MSEEINKLKEYLQYRISELKDSKLFYCENDELKIVDAINGIVDLQQKVEQLENIRKEAIEEIQRVLDIWTNKPNEIATLDLEYLLNILNKGSDKE